MLLRRYGSDGYSVCWLCRELVAQDGHDLRLRKEEEWNQTICEILKVRDKAVEKIMNYQAEVGLIDKRAYEKGDLYIPKLKEYGDDYTKRVRRVSEQTSLGLTEGILKQVIKIYIDKKGFDIKKLDRSDWGRMMRRAKDLLVKTDMDVDAAIEAVKWTAQQGYVDWTLETVCKKYQDKTKKVCSVCKGQGKYTSARLPGRGGGYETICGCDAGERFRK